MSGPNSKEMDALQRLNEALVADLLAAPDEVVLAEARQDGADPEAIAASVRGLFEKVAAAEKKALLAAAKAAVAADRRRLLAARPLDAAEARRRWERILARHPDTAGKLTMAARKGRSGDYSDDEVRGFLEDFDDLGLSSDGEPENRE